MIMDKNELRWRLKDKLVEIMEVDRRSIMLKIIAAPHGEPRYHAIMEYATKYDAKLLAKVYAKFGLAPDPDDDAKLTYELCEALLES